MKNKFITLFLSAVLGVTCLTGCAVKNQSASSEKESEIMNPTENFKAEITESSYSFKINNGKISLELQKKDGGLISLKNGNREMDYSLENYELQKSEVV